jgi:hypothetical protein
VRHHFHFPPHLFLSLCGVSHALIFCRISKMMVLNCTSRAPSHGTSPRLVLAHSSSLPNPRRMPSSSRLQALSMRNLIRSRQALPGRKLSSRTSGR